MAVNPFLSDRFMTEGIPTLRARGLETRLGIDGQHITFGDDAGARLGCEVVVEWTNRQPFGSGVETVDVIGTDGTLSGRTGELTATAGMRFLIQSRTAEITVGTKVDRGVAIAAFRLSEGG